MKCFLKTPLLVLPIFLLVCGCLPEEPEPETHPFLLFKTGSGFITDGATVSPGGQMKFGLMGTGGGGAITNLVVRRIGDGNVITETDRGVYIRTGGIDTVLTYTRGYATEEKWTFFIMNSYRDTASVSLTVLKGEGSAYGDIYYYPSITLGYQANNVVPQFLDMNTGTGYTAAAVAGNESLVDLVMLWDSRGYPVVTCPGYTSAQAYYPIFSSWAVKNITTYDYFTSDNNLITAGQFDAALNDSLLTNGYKPGSVSGFSKYAYTGKIIPFKTAEGKYGLIKVIAAGENDKGTAEVAIKIQK